MSRLNLKDPFILPSQAEQVVYLEYPSKTRDLLKRWTIFKTRPRHFKNDDGCATTVNSGPKHKTANPLQESTTNALIINPAHDVTPSLLDHHVYPKQVDQLDNSAENDEVDNDLVDM